MEFINQYHQIAAVLIARIFLGFLFLFQGYDAVFNIKVKNVIATFQVNFENKPIPKFFIVAASWFTSYTELIGGILLIAGLFEYFALYLLGLNLIIAAIGFGINTPMWDTRYVLPRLLLILFLLVVPQEWNVLSLDHLIFKP
ncbi:MAG: DoxX family membrane protein [Bacteroidota bacterium]|nr:DoxX family membrane protein [Bacteroidota bacterium]